MELEIKCVSAERAVLGESPVWDDRENVLWWVDISAGVILRFDPETSKTNKFDFGEPVGCLALRERGGLVVAAKTGFYFFDPETGESRAIVDPEPDKPLNRFNDGTTDQQGRFWAGTMAEGDDKAGALYALDADLSVTRQMTGFHTINGLAFSPDGTKLFVSDSDPRVQKIWCCPFSGTGGTLGDPSLFFDSRAVAGRPDGGTIDSEGCYWQAGVGGGQLYRLSPAGEVLLTVDLPVERPTKPIFGGKDLKVMFVTSASEGITAGRKQPFAGGLLSISGLGVKGCPQTRFAA